MAFVKHIQIYMEIFSILPIDKFINLFYNFIIKNNTFKNNSAERGEPKNGIKTPYLTDWTETSGTDTKQTKLLGGL